MLNYYHLVINNIPIDFTFVDYSFFYTVEITEFVKDGNWDFENDDIFNVVVKPDPTERDKNQYFAYFLTQPEIEVTGLNKTEDKENNKFIVTFNCLLSTYFPIILYGHNFMNIDKIIYSIDLSTSPKEEYPVFSDSKNIFKNNKLKKGEILTKNNFIVISQEGLDGSNETIIDIYPNYINSLDKNSKENKIFILKIDDIYQFKEKASFDLFIDNFELIQENQKENSENSIQITKIRIKGDQANLLLPYIKFIKDENSSYVYQLFYIDKE
jgi:hypothetical protein